MSKAHSGLPRASATVAVRWGYFGRSNSHAEQGSGSVASLVHVSEALRLIVNGRERVVENLRSPAALTELMERLELRADRVAVELNGELAPRTGWSETQVRDGDRLEIVHFVGGGLS